MIRKRYSLAPLLLAAAAFLLLRGADTRAVEEDRLWRHRNLGKAFYENPTTGAEAVEEFRKALELAPNSFRERLNYGLALLKAGKAPEGIKQIEEAQKQDPSIPHTWFNLGIAYKREGRYEDATRQFERMVALVPDEPVSHYNLGLLYNLAGKEQLALKEFATAARLDPKLVAPTFQIYNTHRLAGREEEAAKALAVFQESKRRQKQFDDSEDMDWSFYSEIYDPIDSRLSAEDAAERAELKFQDHALPGAVDAKSAGLLLLDFDGDGRTDLLAWSSQGLRLYRNGQEPVADSGLGGVEGVLSAAAGDYDNDGLPDLCVLTTRGPLLFKNAKGKFQKADVQLPAGRFERALWLDYDHDYDIDLLLLGEKSVLLRNEGEGQFQDHTAEFPFMAGRPVDVAPLRVVPDTKGMDFVVSYAGRPGVLYRDMMRAQYKAEPLELVPAGARPLVAFDVDNDSWMDLAFGGSQTAILRNHNGRFEADPQRLPAASALVFGDFENRALGDLVAGSGVFRNEGLGKLTEAKVPGLPNAVAWVEADFDQDGRGDLAAVAPDGSLHLLLNQTPVKNRWMRIALVGVKNLKLAPGTEIEIKAGTRYQKKEYWGVPLLFGMRSYQQADTVRISWANGMIQNEPKQATGQGLTVKEAPRLSGSCPMVFTWNGEQFQFISDVLGVAPLGASSGDGGYFAVDHDEYLQLPPGSLALRDGHYEVRITEELNEVSYLDQVRLIALDHPAGVDVYTNEKFKSPPFPEFRLYGVTRPVYPRRAVDGQGRNVLPLVLARDRRYPDFASDFNGRAEMHSLELNFGPSAAPANRSVLILNGWTDWADGSTFLAASQRRGGQLVFPYLQVKDQRGQWVTVLPEMGIPSGNPRTIAVDLTGKFLSASRQVRIVTNMCIYWDQVFLSEETAAPTARLTAVDAGEADLHFRGFSRLILDPRRKQPEEYEYARWQPASNWNQVPGLYTRYGSVLDLLRKVDDRLAVFGAGDEVRLRFPAAGMPPLPSGWKREFLLLVDGWSKDADANTGYAESVQPLPFHAMSSYPYPAAQHFPDGAYEREFNTRPALRPLQPLARK